MSYKKMIDVISWLKHKEITIIKFKEQIQQENEECKGITATIVSIALILLLSINFIHSWPVFSITIFCITIGTYLGVSKLRSKKINEKKESLRINEQELEFFLKDNQNKILDYFNKNEVEYSDEQLTILILIRTYIKEKSWSAVIFNLELLLYSINPKKNERPSFDEKEEIEKEMNMNYQL